MVKTYNIEEAADFLKVNRATAQKLAHSGALPGAKIGRAWVFFEEDLVAYLREKVDGQTKLRKGNDRTQRELQALVTADTDLSAGFSPIRRISRRRVAAPMPL